MVERRQPKPTVDFIDEYCQDCRNLFSDGRGFEAFKFLHMGMISDIKCFTTFNKAEAVEYVSTLP